MKRKYASSILITGAFILNAFSDNHGKISKGIEGEWITFRGDTHEIKNISNGKIKSTFYRFDGQVNFERSADITLKDHSAGEQKTIISQGEEWEYLAAGKTPEDNTWTGLSF